MSPQRKKILIGGLLLSTALGYLAYAGVRSGTVYCVEVDQFISDTHYHTVRVKISGTVSPEKLSVQRGQLLAKFVLQGKERSLPVVYKGMIPDMFKPNHEVIVEGKLDADGVFQADSMLTKCASKYEADGTHPSPHSEMEQKS